MADGPSADAGEVPPDPSGTPQPDGTDVARELATDPFIADLLRLCRFPPPATEVTCAVSGGADSLALLVLAIASGCSVTAVHVDHGLRPGSAGEAVVVAAAAHRFGARFRAETVDVGAGPNLEARARAARYAVLPDDVLIGHTADDRAETMLLNLLRGAGPSGLAAHGPSPRRPILALRRTDTEALCRHLDLEPVVDETNTQPVFRRNRIRHEVLPLLADIADRDLVPILVRQGELFAELERDLEALADGIDPTDSRAVATAPPSIARIAIRRWLLEAGINDGYPPTAAAIDRVLAVARHEHRATEVDGGWRVSRSAGRLRVVPPERQPAPISIG